MIGLSPQIGFDWTVDEKPQRGELGGVVFEATFDRPPRAGECTGDDAADVGIRDDGKRRRRCRAGLR